MKLKIFKHLFFILVFLSTAVLAIIIIQLVRHTGPLTDSTNWNMQKSVTLDQSGDLYHALEELEKALRSPESRSDAEKLLAAISIRKQNAMTTLHDLESQMSDDLRRFKRPKLIFLQGVVHEMLGDDQKAARFFQKSIELKPKLSVSYVRLALLHERHGQFDLAERNFQSALSLNDSAFLTRFHYGMFLARNSKNRAEVIKIAASLEKYRPIYARIIREKLY